MGKGKAKQGHDGGPNFLVRHIEKFVLVTMLLLVFAFVYLGYSLEGLSASQTPDKLSSSAKSAKDHILNPENWKNISTQIAISTGQKEQVAKSQIPTNPLLYAWEKPLEPVNVQVGRKREDPRILPPEKIEVTPILAGVAFRKQPTEDDVLALETNSAYEVKKVKKSRRRDNMYGMDDSGAMPGMMPGMDAGLAASATPSTNPYGMGGMPGMGMDMGMGMGTDMAGMAGGIMANPMERRGVRPGPGAIVKSRYCLAVKAVVPWKRQWEEFDRLYREALGYNPMRDIPRYISFTAQRAEVSDDPNAELVWEDHGFYTTELQRQLRTNEMQFYQYSPEMADPRYVFPMVFTMPVPPFVDRDLTKVATHSLVPKMSPNFMMRELTPEQKAFIEKRIAEMKTKKKSDDPGVQGMQAAQSMPGGAMGGMGGMGGYGGAMPGMGMPGMDMGMGGMPGAMPGMGMPGMDMGMGGMPGAMPGMGMPGMDMGMGGMPGAMPGMGMPGMDMGMGGMPGMGMPGMDMGMGGYGAAMPGMGMPGMGMPGMGMPGMGMPGMEAYGGMGMSGAAPGPQVDYLLIRFFDFGVEGGKKYRYRVQLLIEDPNHPADARMEPIERSLDDSVKKRLLTVTAAEKERKKAHSKKSPLEQQMLSRVYYLRSEFSEPSDIVSVHVPPETIAGGIASAKFTPAPKDSGAPPELLIEPEDPSGKMMAVVHDQNRAVDVPGVVDVHRGSVLNFRSNADVIHPVMLVFKKLTDIDFRTDRVVADIRGGMELPEAKPPGSTAREKEKQREQMAMPGGDLMGMSMGMAMTPEKTEPLLSFGEYAVIDENGRLVVYSEFDDYQNFKRLMLPPQPDSGMGAYGGMPGGEAGAGLPGDVGGGLPGDEGGGRRRRDR